MKINAKVRILNNDTKIKGIADLVLDDVFVVKGLKIMEGSNGVFVSMPSQKVGNEYKETAFPITAEFREKLFETVFSAYEQKLQEEQKSESAKEKENKKSGTSKSKKQAQDKDSAQNQNDESPQEDNQGISGMSGM